MSTASGRGTETPSTSGVERLLDVNPELTERVNLRLIRRPEAWVTRPPYDSRLYGSRAPDAVDRGGVLSPSSH